MYPGNSLPILITGSDGSGKSLLASLIYEFAKEAKIIDKEAPLVKINCRYLTEETDNKMRDVFFSKSSGAICGNTGGNALAFGPRKPTCHKAFRGRFGRGQYLFPSAPVLQK